MSKLSARAGHPKRLSRVEDEKNFEKSRKKFLTKAGRCGKM